MTKDQIELLVQIVEHSVENMKKTEPTEEQLNRFRQTVLALDPDYDVEDLQTADDIIGHIEKSLVEAKVYYYDNFVKGPIDNALFGG